MKKSLLITMTALIAALLFTACADQPSQTQTAAEDAAAAAEKEDVLKEENASGEEATDSKTETTENQEAPENPNKTETEAEADAATEPLTDESIGAVSFMPSGQDFPLVYGNNVLHAYFKRQNVMAGSGKMIIKKASDNTVVEEIDLQDKNKCTVGEIDSTFQILGWNGGTHLVIRLKDMPAQGETYYVNLEEGAFVSQDGSIASKAITDSSTWKYSTAEYGIILNTPNGSDVYVDDVLSGEIIIQGEAVKAEISNYDENRVRFNEKEFKESGELEIKIYQIGVDSFTVTYYDRENNPIGVITVSYTASIKPEPEEEAPKKSVTNL